MYADQFQLLISGSTSWTSRYRSADTLLVHLIIHACQVTCISDDMHLKWYTSEMYITYTFQVTCDSTYLHFRWHAIRHISSGMQTINWSQSIWRGLLSNIGSNFLKHKYFSKIIQCRESKTPLRATGEEWWPQSDRGRCLGVSKLEGCPVEEGDWSEFLRPI
jgi:hypothetical protein